MRTVEPTSYRYWAFISYSNKDRSWARWLHRAIEAYSVPTRLINHPTPTGEPAPKRFRPLFHDRAELPASADLGVAIEEALSASRYLIVICSPSAAGSVWVNKEVETFRLLDRPGRVLAIIVDGEPNAGGTRECFPPALQAVQPAAADARRDGDGKDDAKLKLVAGMLGLGFDVLKQRDAHRRIRRLQAAVAFVLVFALGFAGLALYAQHQRDKAIKARQQAEAILEYMLFDLRDRLKPVDRLDIVQNVQAQVDAYYRELGIEQGNTRTLRNRAVALGSSGDRLLAQGNLAGALRRHREGLRSLERLSIADPTNTGLQRDVSVGHVKLGNTLQALGDLTEARREYRKALVIRKRLASSDPNNIYWQWDLAASHRHLGLVLFLQRDLSKALREHRTALSIMQRLVSSNPDNAEWQHGLSGVHDNLGLILRARGDLQGALREHRAARTIMERLASSDPSNAYWQKELSANLNNLGTALESQGNLAGALREYRAALAIMKRLASSDPSNIVLRRDLASCQSNVLRVIEAQQGKRR